MPLESPIEKQILDYLQLIGIYAWKAYSRTTKYQKRGVSDIIGILPDGRFLAIEVKRPGGKVRDGQPEFLDRINRNGGLGFIATSVEEVIDVLKKEKISR